MQLELVEKMQEAVKEERFQPDADAEMVEDSGQVIGVGNVSSYLGDGHSLQEVVEQMVDKLKVKGKTVKDFHTP